MLPALSALGARGSRGGDSKQFPLVASCGGARRRDWRRGKPGTAEGRDTRDPGGRSEGLASPPGSEAGAGQTQGVADHRYRREAHRRGADHRAQQEADQRVQHAGRDRDRKRIVDKGEEQVLADIAHRRAAQPIGAGDAGEIAFQQRHPGAFDRDIGAGSHRDADIGQRQRRRVVDAVARHGDDMALPLQALDDLALLLGQQPGLERLDPELPRDGGGGGGAVAGQHHHKEPGAGRVVSLIGSATAMSPAIRPSTATNRTVSPFRRRASARSEKDSRAMPSPSSIAELPRTTAWSATCPATPLPIAAVKSRTAASARPRSRAAATIAAARGCSLARSRLAASVNTVSAAMPGAVSIALIAGLPWVSVPVLSMTIVSTFSKRSSTAASRIRIPARAPRPVPTMIAIGVAMPSAHGQAMIRTETAATRP